MSRRVAVRGIIFRDGKLLCVRLKPYPGSIVKDKPYWCTPGGGVDEGEAVIPALEREIMEETGIRAEVGNLLYIQQFSDPGYNEQIELFFHIKNSDDFHELDLANASHAEAEIEVIEFIDPVTNHILPKFLTTESIAEDISKNGPVKIFNYL